MSKQGFISSYKYQLRRIIISSTLSVAAAVVAMLLIAGLVNYSIEGRFSFENAGLPFLDLLTAFMFFIYGCVYIPEFMNTGAANGVSRTTTLIAAMASNFTGSAICSAAVSVISPIVNLLDNGADYFLLEMCYGEKSVYRLYGENAFLVRIRFFLMCTFFAFLCAAVGMAFSSVFYKLPRKGNMILGVALMVIFFFGYPVTYSILEKRGIDLDAILNEFFDGVGRLMGMAHVNGSQAGNCVQGAFMMFIFAAVCGVIAWLFVRRSSVKPAPIRGE